MALTVNLKTSEVDIPENTEVTTTGTPEVVVNVPEVTTPEVVVEDTESKMYKEQNSIAANWSLAWLSGTDQVIATNMFTKEHFEGSMSDFNELMRKFRE